MLQLKKKKGYLLIAAVIGTAVIAWGAFQSYEKPETPDFSDVDTICEMATLKCFYHNVAEYEKQPDGLFQYGLFQYGYKKMWMEYDGVIIMGIDASKVKLNGPDENNVVQIYVPEARVMNAEPDQDTMGEPIVDTGVFTKITIEEEAKALTDAQNKMLENAEQDTLSLEKARSNAKALLKEYVINIGKLTGQNYTVEWLSEPGK